MAMNFERIAHVCALAALVLVPCAEAQDARKAADNPKAVVPTPRRKDALEKASALLVLAPANSDALTAEMVDPFYPTHRRQKEKESAPVEIAPEVLLSRAAESIRPQGTLLIGAERYLLLENNRRYKAGESIPVTVDGLGVQVTVVSIERNSYTLRLNDRELRREFK